MTTRHLAAITTALCLAASASAQAKASRNTLTLGSPRPAEGCVDVQPTDTCSVHGTADSAGVASGWSHFESLADPSALGPDATLDQGHGYGGGYYVATHRLPRGAKQVVYRVTFEVVPYDDPRTEAIEADGLKTSYDVLGSSFANGQINARMPDCNSVSCYQVTYDEFAGPAAGAPATLEPGTRRTLELTVSAPAGGTLKHGTVYVWPRFNTYVRADLPGGSADASGAMKIVSLTADVT